MFWDDKVVREFMDKSTNGANSWRRKMLNEVGCLPRYFRHLFHYYRLHHDNGNKLEDNRKNTPVDEPKKDIRGS